MNGLNAPLSKLESIKWTHRQRSQICTSRAPVGAKKDKMKKNIHTNIHIIMEALYYNVVRLTIKIANTIKTIKPKNYKRLCPSVCRSGEVGRSR